MSICRMASTVINTTDLDKALAIGQWQIKGFLEYLNGIVAIKWGLCVQQYRPNECLSVFLLELFIIHKVELCNLIER